MSRLRDTYESEIKKALTDKFGYKNVMQIPRLEKIVINMGVGEAKENSKVMESAVKDLTTIAGQKPVILIYHENVRNILIRNPHTADSAPGIAQGNMPYNICFCRSEWICKAR